MSETLLDFISDIHIVDKPNLGASVVYMLKRYKDSNVWMANEDESIMSLVERIHGAVLSSWNHQEKPSDFMMTFMKKYRYRVHVSRTVSDLLFTLRRIPNKVPSLDKLGLPKYIVQSLLDPSFRDGMIIICGSHGMGKSTTAASVVATRLERYGGVAITVEDPIEMPLQGRHGKGFCYQHEVVGAGANEFAWMRQIQGAQRQYPTNQRGILMIGEIRDRWCAAEAMRMSVSGVLVIATIHAMGPTEAMNRLVALASDSVAIGDKDKAALKDLSNALRVLVHQELVDLKTPNGTRTVPNALIINNNNEATRSRIASGNFSQLEEDAIVQSRRMR